MRRVLQLFLLTLLVGSATANTEPELSGLDTLLRAAEQRPSRALDALRKQPAPQQAEALAYRRYVEARLLQRVGQPEQALAQFTGEAATGAAALLLRAYNERSKAHRERMGELAQRALQQLPAACLNPVAESGCQPARLAFDAWQLVANAQRISGQLNLSIKSTQQAKALAKQIGDPLRVVDALVDEAMVLGRRDEVPEAHERLREAEQLVQGAGAEQAIARGYLLLREAALLRRSTEMKSHRELLERALEVAITHDAPGLATVVRTNLADHFLLVGDAQRARELTETVLNDPELRHEIGRERTLRHNLSVALIALREFDAARAQMLLSEQLEARMQEPVPERTRANRLRELGKAWTQAAQWRDALRAYHEERRLSASVNAAEDARSLAEVQKDSETAATAAKLQLQREQEVMQRSALSNQRLLDWIVILAGVLVGLSLITGAVFWAGSQAANRRLRRSQAQLQGLSERDPLTQLGNRRAFQQAMAARGDEALTGGLLLVDVDHFKRVNDQHGHGVGDAVLQAVAQRLAAQVRRDDLLVRWGGEEFLLHCPNLAPAAVRLLAQRLLRALEGSPLALEDGPTLQISASIGFAVFPLPPQRRPFHWERAVNWIDLALYRAKNTGRARAVGIVSAALSDETALELVEADFEGAVSAARVELVVLRASEG